MTRRLHRDAFGATGTLDDEGYYTPYESEKEAAAAVTEEHLAQRGKGETSFFRQKQSVEEEAETSDETTEDDPEDE